MQINQDQEIGCCDFSESDNEKFSLCQRCLKKNMKVSVITVCYNCESDIENTLKSVIHQTYSDFEYIIIDGNSTDNTLEVIKQYSDNLDYIVSESDNGIYNAMNKGLDICSGDYVLFVNCGDQLFNERVLENLISKTNGQDIIYGDLILDFANGVQTRVTQPAVVNKYYFIYQTILHPASLVKRSVFQLYGKFREDYLISGDFEFFLRVVFKPDVSLIYLSSVISVFDMNGISNDPKTFRLRQRDRLRIQKEYLPFFLYKIAKFRFLLMKHRKKYFPKKYYFY